MADTLVERNPIRFDEEDMDAILAALRDLDRDPQPTDQEALFKAAWWVLVLHWLSDDATHFAFDSFLTVLGHKVWKHFRDREKDPPKRIDVLDAKGNTLASQEVEEPEGEPDQS